MRDWIQFLSCRLHTTFNGSLNDGGWWTDLYMYIITVHVFMLHIKLIYSNTLVLITHKHTFTRSSRLLSRNDQYTFNYCIHVSHLSWWQKQHTGVYTVYVECNTSIGYLHPCTKSGTLQWRTSFFKPHTHTHTHTHNTPEKQPYTHACTVPMATIFNFHCYHYGKTPLKITHHFLNTCVKKATYTYMYHCGPMPWPLIVNAGVLHCNLSAFVKVCKGS